MINSIRRLSLILSACFIFPSAFAQDSGDTSDTALEEIIVTAQKRAESIQDIGITIQAFSGEELENAGLISTDFMGQVVTNLQSGRQISGSTPYLRGVGTQNSAMGDESSIALYVDDVYIASMYASDIYFNNLDRVEVLKGPQGTLYGRNATGGLMHIVTKDPSQDSSGQVGMTYENYETFTANLYATGGFGESVAADIAVAYRDQGEGYGTNLTTGLDSNWFDYSALRSKWLFTPSDKARITLIADYQDREGTIGLDRGPIPGALGIDGQLIFGGCMATVGDPVICQGAAIAGATKTPDDRYDIQSDVGNESRTKQWGLSGKIEYSFNSFDLVSITAYRDVDVTDRLDQEATPFDVINAPLPREESQLSQEFQLLSTSGGPMSWILGLYYLDFDAAYTPFQLLGAGLPLLAPGLSSLTLPVTQDTESIAGFAQMSYEFSDRWMFTGGLRYTRDERKLDGTTMFDFGGFLVDVPFSESESWSEPTWRLALDFSISDDLLLFGSYSRGFKSGVYNSVVTTGVPQPPVEPEILDAFELGFKSTLADGRARFNGAVFYYDYEDLQLTAISAGIIRLANAASAEVTGLEFDLQVAATEHLMLNAGIGFLDTEYKDFDCVITSPTGIGGNTQTPTEGGCNGNDLIRAPDSTFNIGASWDIPTDSGNFRTSFNWYFNSGFFWEPDNRVKEPSYDILNVELSWTNASGAWRLRAFGKNLTDAYYNIYMNTGQFGDLGSAAPPLTWGLGVDFFWQ